MGVYTVCVGHYLFRWWSSRFSQVIQLNDSSMMSQELTDKVAEEVRADV